MKRLAQTLAITLARPYIFNELPGWGKVLDFVASYRRDWLWDNAPERVITGKLHRYKMHLALSTWADRSTYFIGRWYDLETQLILRDMVPAGSCVVDVGANRGMFALTAASVVGSGGKVICFEPNPRCLDLLRRELRANKISNVEVRPVGLSDAATELTLTVPHQNSGSGTLGHGLYGRDISYQIKIPVRVGDAALESLTPKLIKIDVEGFEMRVLRGLKQTLARAQPIVLHEATAELLKASGASLLDIADFMNDLGYAGFAVGLMRRGGRHDWVLNPLSSGGANFDAAWFHVEAMTGDVKRRIRS